MVTHFDTRHLTCETCGKSFKTSSALAGHVGRVHLKKQPYGCSFCPKRFFKRSDHQIHERMHTKEKPHLCEQCGKSFSSLSSLRSHELSHMDQSAYHKCSICNRKYSQYEFYRRHVVKYHPDKFGMLKKDEDLAALLKSKSFHRSKSIRIPILKTSSSHLQQSLQKDAQQPSTSGISDNLQAESTNSTSDDLRSIAQISHDQMPVENTHLVLNQVAPVPMDMPTLVNVVDMDFVDTLLSNTI